MIAQCLWKDKLLLPLYLICGQKELPPPGWKPAWESCAYYGMVAAGASRQPALDPHSNLWKRLGAAGQSCSGAVHLWVQKQSFVCEPPSLVLMKADTYLKNFPFLSGRGRRRGGHSKPTSWYKFAERNTGPIVCRADAGCIQIESPLKCPLPCMAQWSTYNKSTKGALRANAAALSFYLFTVFNWTVSLKLDTLPTNQHGQT